MKIESSPIFSEVKIIYPDVFEDSRGFFLESYSYKKYKELGIDINFVQDNHSKSVKNTIRGLHFQEYPGQNKLLWCTKGKIWDVAVDIRKDSPTFKKWFGIELSAENFKRVFIPIGFAHGFSVLSDEAEVQYKVSNYYDPNIEKGIKYDDPSINVDWKVEKAIISKRDKLNPLLDEYLQSNPDPFEKK